MNIHTPKAKALCLGAAFMAAAALPVNADSRTVKTVAVTEPAAATADKTADEASDITNFFSSYLPDMSGTYGGSRPLSEADFDAARDEVWAAWCEANNAFDEEKLIPLAPLAQKKSGVWNLPSNLEPNAVMNYWFGYKGRTADNVYPLFVYLHGSGDRDSEWNGGHTLCTSFNDSPSLYFIPQIPNTGEYYRWWQKAKQYAWEKLLRQVFVAGYVDPNRVYFFGISEGGYGSQRLASFYADYLAAAGPMAGGEPLINAPAENCRHIAFSLRTGANDNGFCRNQLTTVAKETFDSLQALYPDDYVHNVQLIPGQGHGIDYSPTTPWLKRYTRRLHPKHVNWENYSMDGIQRKGFYNLVVTDDPGSGPVYYCMDIEGNHISITADRVRYYAIQTDASTGIAIRYRRVYSTVRNGKVLIYLNNDMVDLSQPVTVTVNGNEYFEGMLQPDVKHMVNSCATFFDPERIYPAAIEVNFRPGATPVESVELSDAAAPRTPAFYDLSGRRVEKPGSGIYVTSTGEKVYRQ